MTHCHCGEEETAFDVAAEGASEGGMPAVYFLPHSISFLRTVKPCLKGDVGLAVNQDFCLVVHYLRTISKVEERSHFLTSSPLLPYRPKTIERETD